MVVVRTGDEAEGDAAELLSLCLSDRTCLDFDNLERTRLRNGNVDHFSYEVPTPDVARMDRVHLERLSDPHPGRPWTPDCLAIVADGALVYCRDTLREQLSAVDPAQAQRWFDGDAAFMGCGGCYDTVLTHGPLVGHTTLDSATLWLRTAYSMPVVVEWATAEDFADGRAVGPVWTRHPEDFTVHVRLRDLPAGTRIHYRVRAGDDVVSEPGLSFETAPPHPGSSTFVFGSCSNPAVNPAAPVYATMREMRPDAVLLVGDNHYADTTDLGRLEAAYRRTREDPLLAALVGRTPTWAIWDDHDFAGNDTFGDAPGKESALLAFRRYWANGSYGASGAKGIFSRFSWGAAEVFLLDTRYHRARDGSTMLGAEQLAWLRSGLRDSTAPFKLLVSSSQWSLDGSADSWAMFPHEREALFDFIMDSNVSGVVLLSGDVHRAELRRVREASDKGYALWELTSSPLNAGNHACPRTSQADELVMCDDVGANFGVVRVSEAGTEPSVTLEAWRANGSLLGGVTLPLSDLSL
jgi:alkaline phosphatase D